MHWIKVLVYMVCFFFCHCITGEVMGTVLSTACQLFPLWYSWGWGQLTVRTLHLCCHRHPCLSDPLVELTCIPFQRMELEVVKSYPLSQSSLICGYILIKTGLCSILPFCNLYVKLPCSILSHSSGMWGLRKTWNVCWVEIEMKWPSMLPVSANPNYWLYKWSLLYDKTTLPVLRTFV